MKRIVLFASGSGTNVENIVKYFDGHSAISIIAVFTNKRDAFVIDRCNSLNISAYSFNRSAFSESGTLLKILRGLEPDLIVLAGFLWKIPLDYVQTFSGKIINIHPALLPKYGGKGMYGRRVHQEVKDNMETESGITIHYVNENYDEGSIIFQARVAIGSEDSVEDIANKVHALEYKHYPTIIEELLTEDHG